MLREDFKLKTNFGKGIDWPIELDEVDALTTKERNLL
jgi:hypothetical protein